jgi:solute carrier family 25 protein 33/36
LFHSYFTQGFSGFYKGVTASYWGISETVIHWVIYERLKKAISLRHHFEKEDTVEKVPEEFFEYMVAAAVSKTCAAIFTYPHGTSSSPQNFKTGRKRILW